MSPMLDLGGHGTLNFAIFRGNNEINVICGIRHHRINVDGVGGLLLVPRQTYTKGTCAHELLAWYILLHNR